MKIFNTCGVDTVEKEYSKELDLMQYNSYMSAEYSILSEQVRHTYKRTTKIPFKPSHYYYSNRGQYLTNIKESLAAIRELETRLELDCKKNIIRLDIAFDSYIEFENIRNIMLMLLECLAKELGAKEVLNTRAKKDIKNIKFRAKDIEITCYNCKDKNRAANTRLEFRFLNIKKSKRTDENIINSKLREISSLLAKSLKHFSEVEESYFTYIANRYKEQDFYTFYIENKELILTSRISQVIFDSLAPQKSHKSFLRVVRNRANIEFVTKKDLILLVAELKSLINNLLENDTTSIKNKSFEHLLSA